MTRSHAVLAAAVVVTVLTGCGADDSEPTTTLTVFAASSLTETFTSLEAAFEDARPDVEVVVSYGSSSTLAAQIDQGAPADLIATADESSMGMVFAAGLLAAEPRPFASNTLVIVTPPDNPADIDSLDDLRDSDYLVCDPAAPCGAASRRILERSGVTAEPRSLEPDVKSVLTRVALGEADAGLVYVTDAQAAGDDVGSVQIPAEANVVIPYYIAPVKNSANAELAEAWISLVGSEAGRRVFEDAGFGPP